MPAPYSLDLRRRVLAAAHDDRLAPGVIAARFRVGESTARLWLRRARETGRVAAKPHGGGMPPQVDAAGAPVLEALVGDKTERTLAELADVYRARTGTPVSVDAVRRACKRLDLRRKKNQLRGQRADASGRGRGA